MDVANEQAAKFITKWQAKEFIWGESDCSNFFCDAVKLVTEQDFSELCGHWENKNQAVKWFARNGTIAQAIHEHLKYKKLDGLLQTRTGDFCLLQHDSGMETVALMYDMNLVVVTEEFGIQVGSVANISGYKVIMYFRVER